MNHVPVIMAVKDRPELTKQAVESCLTHTNIPVQLILVDDASTDQETRNYLDLLAGKFYYYRHAIQHTIRVIRMPEAKYVGAVKNAGAAVTEPGRFIYFSDNDVYFYPDWLQKMIWSMESDRDIGILGGDRHPHHGTIEDNPDIVYSDQQVGYSMMLRQEVWRKAGPFDHAPFGTFGMEDTNLCNRVTDLGLRIASVNPRVVEHCGLTSHSGLQVAGYPDYMARTVPEEVIRL